MERQEVGSCVSEIGFPEIDRVLQASLFTTKSSFQDLLVGIQSQKFQRQPEMRPCKFSRHTTNSMVGIQSQKFQRQPEMRPCKFSRHTTNSSGLDQLPDHILQSIISRLTTLKEAAATSVLSRRWRCLWTTSVSTPNFDLANKVGHDYLTHDKDALFRLRIDKDFLTNERDKFTTWVDRVLLQSCPRTSNINALRVAFALGKESASRINQWMQQYAANDGLTQLELDFGLLLFAGLSTRAAYDFPFQLFTSSPLNHLRLSCLNFKLPPDFKGFNSLKSLTLRQCYLTKDNLHNILSNCSLLECLSLLCCEYLGFPNHLKLSGPSLRLKHLRLFTAYRPRANIEKIELHDVNIISFEFEGLGTKLSIKNAPHLARLVLYTRTPVDILSEVPRVETLFMATWSQSTESILPKLDVFNNLKRLVFIADDDIGNLLQVICLLETCPSLQKLELDMAMLSKAQTENPSEIATRPVCPYTNLKEIEIYGFQDHLDKIEFVKCLLKNAVVLQKMKIFTAGRKYLGNGEWTLYEETAKQTRISLMEVRKLFKKEARSSTEIEIFCR